MRGKIEDRRLELVKQHNAGTSLPFNKFYQLNIGNSHIVGQVPISFPREVMSYLFSEISDNSDACRRANELKKYLGKTLGNSTDYRGSNFIRKNVASFISKRDNVPCDSYDIFLTNGASNGVDTLLNCLVKNQKDSAMVPIPQYPIYSALMALYNGTLVPYYMNEKKGWSITRDALDLAYEEAQNKNLNLKMFILINPGNPTGNVVSNEDITEIAKFCYEKKMVLVADEVYQHNVYNEEMKFTSARKIVSELPEPYNQLAVFSLNSVSKGYLGECGLRGGYCDMLNIPLELKQSVLKLRQTEMCSNIVGQVAVNMLVDPPRHGRERSGTVEKFDLEKNKQLFELGVKADIMTEYLNKVPGISCQRVNGAMYAFCKIDLPSKYIELAKTKDMPADEMFAIELLDETGISTTSGSGFLQEPGTYHLRLTNLVTPVEEFEKVIKMILDFYQKTKAKYE